MKTIPKLKKHYFRCINPEKHGSRFALGEEIVSHGKTPEIAHSHISLPECWEYVRTEEMDYKHAAAVAAIAAELGENWTCEPISEEYADCNFWMTRDDGLKLFIDGPGGYRNPEHFVCQVSPPRHRGSYIEPRKPGSWDKIPMETAKISASKTPAQIAKDIARRVLPNAEEITAAVNEYIKKTEEAENARESALRQFSESMGLKYTPMKDGSTPPDHRYQRVYFTGGHAEISHKGEVELHFDRLPVTEAIKRLKQFTK